MPCWSAYWMNYRVCLSAFIDFTCMTQWNASEKMKMLSKSGNCNPSVYFHHIDFVSISGAQFRCVCVSLTLSGVEFSQVCASQSLMVLVNPQSGRGQAMSLYTGPVLSMLTEANVSHTLITTGLSVCSSIFFLSILWFLTSVFMYWSKDTSSNKKNLLKHHIFSL